MYLSQNNKEKVVSVHKENVYWLFENGQIIKMSIGRLFVLKFHGSYYTYGRRIFCRWGDNRRELNEEYQNLLKTAQLYLKEELCKKEPFKEFDRYDSSTVMRIAYCLYIKQKKISKKRT